MTFNFQISSKKIKPAGNETCSIDLHQFLQQVYLKKRENNRTETYARRHLSLKSFYKKNEPPLQKKLLMLFELRTSNHEPSNLWNPVAYTSSPLSRPLTQPSDAASQAFVSTDIALPEYLLVLCLLGMLPLSLPFRRSPTSFPERPPAQQCPERRVSRLSTMIQLRTASTLRRGKSRCSWVCAFQCCSFRLHSGA